MKDAPLPDFNSGGDLPPGVYGVTLEEVVRRFGGGSPQREKVTGRLNRIYFDHQQADQEFEASIFWIRPSLLILETLEEFTAHWQVKRDKSRRGILEIIA